MHKKGRFREQKLASAVVMLGAAALTVTTVVLAAGPSGGSGEMGSPGGMGGSTGKMDVAQKSASVITVNLAAPTMEDMRKTTDFIGKLEAAGSVSVYPAASGKIDQIYFEAGQQVKAGDLLMRLDSGDLVFELEVAQASYQEKVVSANKTLGSDYTSKIISAQNTLDKANRSYRTARQQYATEANLEDDDLEKADNKRNAAKTAWDEARAVWNQAKEAYQNANGGSTAGMDEDSAVQSAYNAYTKAYQSYQDADDDYYTLTQKYDDSTSVAAVSKDNAYKDILQAKESLDLTTGTAYDEQRAVIEAGLISAQLSLQKAERALDKTYVYAPVSGTIESRNVSRYEMASTNAAAYTIVGDDAVQVAFHVSSGGAAALSLGDTVTVTQGSDQYTATIVEIETKADSTTGLFPIKASLSESGGTLLPGVSVKVTATTALAENALTIPLDSVYFENDQPYVFTYFDGKAHRNDLVFGMMSADTAEIASGLTAAEFVITTWHPDLKDGATVTLSDQARTLTGEPELQTQTESAAEPANNAGEASAAGDRPLGDGKTSARGEKFADGKRGAATDQASSGGASSVAAAAGAENGASGQEGTS